MYRISGGKGKDMPSPTELLENVNRNAAIIEHDKYYLKGISEEFSKKIKLNVDQYGKVTAQIPESIGESQVFELDGYEITRTPVTFTSKDISELDDGTSSNMICATWRTSVKHRGNAVLTSRTYTLDNPQWSEKKDKETLDVYRYISDNEDDIHELSDLQYVISIYLNSGKGGMRYPCIVS